MASIDERPAEGAPAAAESGATDQAPPQQQRRATTKGDVVQNDVQPDEPIAADMPAVQGFDDPHEQAVANAAADAARTVNFDQKQG